ncbi:MAG: DUF3727 domain-containing protein [Limnospira sp. PMC 1291.21]|uniref:DUF3727 domain-containing protein n=3 Tax=Limnospira TaxID=2596745 RepID=A0A9P1KKM9_9CYAN|nr:MULTISPECIES: DUF3727 domain-containing protein [Limnospira]AMW29807.1 hypothetical protein AP285_19550 [Arthrospira platensis YZ]MBD2669484.1 DUF3727 domain-containing protein [Arthrospira platensis FACHB-439]MDC0837682.1 DUF3727 domain-containing protein [Limnoraphis robusta]MDY7054319.1 DUF3727 domain-containing protein [Limnospira fusiformis LS22]QJB24987.1 DUF3727 domain-containing protein [Limnospira fusiformis SAG 85.79]
MPSQFSDENIPEPEATTLTDEQGRSIECTIESSFSLDGEEYILLLPLDTPVEILTWSDDEDEEVAVPVESEAVIDSIFDTAKVVLEEQNLTLKRTAVTLTVAGELPEDIFDNDVEENGSVGGGEEDYEELLMLTTFYHEEQEYGIYTPLDPFFIMARMNEKGEPQLLSSEELDKIEPLLPMIEEKLFGDFS